MARTICPHCGASVKLDVYDLGIFFEEVTPGLTCESCGREFLLPEDIRKHFQAQKDYNDLIRLDFFTDGAIDGNFK